MGNDVFEINKKAYGLLINIETVIRELIIRELSRVCGPKWYKQRLPSDILEKYKKAIEYEKKLKWIELVPHHPIYYIEFSDLKKIILREDNWQTVFKYIFGQKDLISTLLSGLELTRNKIAHNRIISSIEYENLNASYLKIENFIGESNFSQFLNNMSVAPGALEDIQKLKNITTESYDLCTQYKIIDFSSDWIKIINHWWFDETYLSFTIDDILVYYNLIGDYCAFPKHRGTGHIIERWVKDSKLKQSYDRCIENIESLLGEWGGWR